MKQEQKKLSIIVPVYNAEQYMEKCLNRLLEQSYSNIEIIIVNDCSQGNCEEIANKYKDAEIYFIMGSDNFKKMPSWKNYEEIIKKYKFIVIERPNYEETANLENVITYKIEQPEDMSSTKIRNMLKQGKDTSLYLNKNVIGYIQKHNLY